MIGRSSEEPLDIALGSRVRLRRKELGMSQDHLARALGITFQQIQKYEHGTNRISFSRLVGICGALKCSVADLVSDLDNTKASKAMLRQISYLSAPGATNLLDAYSRLGSSKHRLALLNLARQLSREDAKG
jgi:transcriptional regulator with XRE-family HTH domain